MSSRTNKAMIVSCVIGLLLMLAGCSSSGLGGSAPARDRAVVSSSTQPPLHQASTAPLQPNANPTDAELRDYWERTIVRPLRSGRLRGRVVTKSGKPIEGIRVETVLTQWSARGRDPAFPESIVVTNADGTFDLPAEAPRRNEQFMLHVQQLPYVLQVWQLGLVGAGQPDARAKQSRGEGTLAFSTAFDPVAARGMLARGELMPSTAIEGGVDVVVRRLADDEQYAKDAERLMDTLEDVTRGVTKSKIKELEFSRLAEGDILLQHVIFPDGSSDREAVLVRAPVDGYYTIGMIDLLGPGQINAERTRVLLEPASGGIFVRKGDLIGFVEASDGRVYPASRTERTRIGEREYNDQFRVWLEPKPITYAWAFRRARPDVK